MPLAYLCPLFSECRFSGGGTVSEEQFSGSGPSTKRSRRRCFRNGIFFGDIFPEVLCSLVFGTMFLADGLSEDHFQMQVEAFAGAGLEFNG